MDAFKFNPAEPKPTEPGFYITKHTLIKTTLIEEVHFDGHFWRYKDSRFACYRQDRQWLPVEALA